MSTQFNSQACDFPGQTEVHTTYVICSSPRSGSTLLCRGLWDTGLAGAPHEYFHQKKHMPELSKRWGVQDFNAYLGALLRFRTSENGVFGFKAHYEQFQLLTQHVDLNQTFPGLKYIRIKRRELIRQAISLEKSIQTKQWSSEEAVQDAATYDYEQIKKRIDMILDSEQGWDHYLEQQKINHLTLHYEDFVGDYAQSIKSVLKYLGIGRPAGFVVKQPTLKKQADAVNEAWFERFVVDFKREQKALFSV